MGHAARIPTPEVRDSDFGAFEAAALETAWPPLADKARAVAHYSAMAGQAAATCTFTHLCPLQDAAVEVEFEAEPADGDGWDEPYFAGSLYATRAKIGDAWVGVEAFAQHVIDRWETAGLAEWQRRQRQQPRVRLTPDQAERLDLCGGV